MTIASGLDVNAEKGAGNPSSVGGTPVGGAGDWGAGDWGAVVQDAGVGGTRVWGAHHNQEFASADGAIAGGTKTVSGEGNAVPAGMSFRAQWETVIQRMNVQRSMQETEGALQAQPNAVTQTNRAAEAPLKNQRANTTAQAVPTPATSSPLNSNAPDPAALTSKTDPVNKDAVSGETILPDASALDRQEAGRSSQTRQGGGAVHSTGSERRENLSTRNATTSLAQAVPPSWSSAVAQPFPPADLPHTTPTPDLPANPENSAGLTAAMHSQQTAVPDASAGARTGQPIEGASATDNAAAWSSAQKLTGTNRQVSKVQGAPQSNANFAPAESAWEIGDLDAISGKSVSSNVFPGHSEQDSATPSASEHLSDDTETDRSNAQSHNPENVVAPEMEGPAIASPVTAAARAAGNGENFTKTSPDAAQSAREKDAGTSGNSVVHVVTAQGAVATADSSLVMRVAAGERGAASGQVVNREPSSQSAAGVAVGTRTGDTFAALDASGGVGLPSWIHAGHQSAEAGFQDPALGWVGVRAELSGGNVHASLVPGSAEAAQALSTHLPGLSAHLSEERVPVSMVTMASPKESGFSLDAGQGQQQNTQQNEGQSDADAPNLGERDSQTSNSNGPAGSSAIKNVETGPAVRVGTRGTHISVMA